MDELAEREPSRRRGLHARLSIVSVAYLALFLISSILAGLTVRAWNHSVEQRSVLRELRDDVADLRLAMSDQESGINGYMRASDDQFLALYRDGLSREAAALAQIQPRVDLVTTLPSDVHEVRTVARSWRADAVEPQIQRKLDGGEASPALIELSGLRFDDVRAALEDLASHVDAEVRRSEDRVRDVSRNAVAGMVAAFTAALACTVAAVWLFRRWITKPLSEISTAARAIAGGEMTAMPTFDTAEFGDVADAIDSMQRSLSDERDRAIRAYEGLEQSAVLALQVRSELADERARAPGGWSLATKLRAAEGFVAGDCYETGLIDQHTMYIVVIDVTGHGAKAALSALKAKAQLRSALRTGLSPGLALGWLAREHHDDAVDDFVTAFVAVVDIATGECRWANAGHPPALVVADGVTLELPYSGPLIGPFDSEWSTETVAIPPDGILVVYTDGLTEARGENRSRLGELRLQECLETSIGDGGGPDEIVASLIRLVDGFQIGSPTDDVTIVAVSRSVAANGATRAETQEARPSEADSRPASASSLSGG